MTATDRMACGWVPVAWHTARYALLVSSCWAIASAPVQAQSLGPFEPHALSISPAFLGESRADAPSDLVHLLIAEPEHDFSILSSLAVFSDFRHQLDIFSDLAAYSDGLAVSVTLGRRTEARVVGSVVSGNYFHLLGVRAVQGRLLSPSDEIGPHSNPVIVLSERLAERFVTAGGSIVGQVIRLQGRAFEVVGVAPRDFAGARPTSVSDFWIPLSCAREVMPEWGSSAFADPEFRWLSLIGRLQVGLTIADAKAKLAEVALRLQLAQNADAPPTSGSNVAPNPCKRRRFELEPHVSSGLGAR